MNATGPIITHEGPTGCSTLDYVLVPNSLTNEVSEIVTEEEHPLNCSDHNPVRCKLKISSLRFNHHSGRGDMCNKRWDKLGEVEMFKAYRYTQPLIGPLNTLSLKLDSQTLSTEGLDDIMDSVVKILKCADKTIPSTKYRANLKPYWNERLTQLKKDKVFKHRAWVSAGRPRDLDSTLWAAHKYAKKTFSKEIRKLHRHYEDQKVSEAVNSAGLDKSYFWKLLNF